MVGWFYHVHGSGLAVLIFVMTFVAGHAFGNGVACWVIISEIYPTKVQRTRHVDRHHRAVGRGIPGQSEFSAHAEIWEATAHSGVFSAAALLNLLCVLWLVPETRANARRHHADSGRHESLFPQTRNLFRPRREHRKFQLCQLFPELCCRMELDSEHPYSTRSFPVHGTIINE